MQLLPCEIESLNRFRIKVKGVDLGEFEEGKTWNGMTEYIGPDGQIIIDSKSTLFDNAFFRKAATPGTVIKISTSLALKLEEKLK